PPVPAAHRICAGIAGARTSGGAPSKGRLTSTEDPGQPTTAAAELRAAGDTVPLKVRALINGLRTPISGAVLDAHSGGRPDPHSGAVRDTDSGARPGDTDLTPSPMNLNCCNSNRHTERRPPASPSATQGSSSSRASSSSSKAQQQPAAAAAGHRFHANHRAYIPGKAALYIRIIKGENLRAHDANDYPILISLKLEDDDRGKILIGLYYAPAKNELTVRIIQCVNLICHGPKRIQRSFCQLCPGAGSECSGERRSHWEALLRQPYQRHERWHALWPELSMQSRSSPMALPQRLNLRQRYPLAIDSRDNINDHWNPVAFPGHVAGIEEMELADTPCPKLVPPSSLSARTISVRFLAGVIDSRTIKAWIRISATARLRANRHELQAIKALSLSPAHQLRKLLLRPLAQMTIRAATMTSLVHGCFSGTSHLQGNATNATCSFCNSV
uniref:GAE domain-containing protein n=1 Tax=Macrostomum lignano TaxID=282301 RepID=A0A1I8FD38_9PLAT